MDCHLISYGYDITIMNMYSKISVISCNDILLIITDLSIKLYFPRKCTEAAKRWSRGWSYACAPRVHCI